MTPSSPIDVVEAAYRAGASSETWLHGVLEAAAPLLHPGMCATGYFFDFSEPAVPPVHGVQVLGAPPSLADDLAAFHDRNREVSRTMLHAGPVVTTGSQFVPAARLAPEFGQYTECFTKAGIRIGDTLGVVGVSPSCQGVALGCVYDRPTKLSRSARRRWTRIAVHVEAGSRLRSALGTLHSGEESRPDAILSPSGRVEHAEGEAREAGARESLRARAVAIDRARGRLRRSDPDSALETWQGLVAGRWSLVDRFESDGRRYVVAHRNPPKAARILSLTAREREVVGHRMRGHSAKLIGYTLGISPAAVSAALKSSLQKLGVGTLAEMLNALAGVARSGASFPEGDP
jgi:DNA-binding CsgD family transcriptional regulator